MKYFHASFVQRNKYWFAVAKQTPTTNNASESINASIKIHQTFWQRKGIHEFLHRGMQIVKDRSLEYKANNQQPKAPFSKEIEISDKLKVEGLELAKSELQFVNRKSTDGKITKIYCCSKKNQISDQEVDDFLQTQWNGFQNFDDFVAAVNSIRIITFDADARNWKNASCTCKDYIKRFSCKHIVAIALRLKILAPLVDPDDEPIKPNKKKGRPKKFSKGLRKD